MGFERFAADHGYDPSKPEKAQVIENGKYHIIGRIKESEITGADLAKVILEVSGGSREIVPNHIDPSHTAQYTITVTKSELQDMQGQDRITLTNIWEKNGEYITDAALGSEPTAQDQERIN